MKNTKIIFLVSLMILCVLFVGCDKKPTTTPTDKTPSSAETTDGGNDVIVINEISNIASAKLLAESKVIEKEELPEDLQYIADAILPVELNMINAVYTKSDMTKEEFDVLHDYHFFFADENGKYIIVEASKEGAPLRDYFFQAESNPSSIKGIEVIISRYENKFIVQFKQGEVQFDIETEDVSQKEFVDAICQLIK